jgi:hypothetical protein
VNDMGETIYKYGEKLSDFLIGLIHRRFGKQLWYLSKARKEHKCCITQEVIKKGMHCWRPLGNPYNRMERISENGMDIVEQTLKGE